jgi:hypothetical protein
VRRGQRRGGLERSTRAVRRHQMPEQCHGVGDVTRFHARLEGRQPPSGRYARSARGERESDRGECARPPRRRTPPPLPAGCPVVRECQSTRTASASLGQQVRGSRRLDSWVGNARGARRSFADDTGTRGVSNPCRGQRVGAWRLGYIEGATTSIVVTPPSTIEPRSTTRGARAALSWQVITGPRKRTPTRVRPG